MGAVQERDSRTGGIDCQPVNAVEWVPRADLRANDYNPNHVAPQEMKLLIQSILADGWTQPIVARRDGEIVDGFHRWTCSADPEVFAMTDGLIPVVYIEPEFGDQMMSTVRHNRARGQHAVLSMANIVRNLLETGRTPEDLERLLGMEDEEIERLADASGMPNRAGEAEIGKGWIPTE